MNNNQTNYSKLKNTNCKPLKVPAQKAWSMNLHTDINTKLYNVGIPCGKINNIIILDVDDKDNGLKEFEKYVKGYGKPNTVKQTTPNNGFHLIFKVTHSD